MTVIPLAFSSDEMDLAIVLEDDNIQRMMEHDPAEVVKSQMGKWSGHAIRNVIVCYASPEDMTTFKRLMEHSSLGEAMQFLARGFRYRPDRGDTDGKPYTVRP